MLTQLLKKPLLTPLLGLQPKPWHWPAHIPTDGWEPVTFSSRSGAHLSAILGRTSRAETQGSVVLCHPLRSDAKGFFLKYGHADLLRQLGYDVLAFDFNGIGQSTEGSFAFEKDVRAAVEFMYDHDPRLPIAVLGVGFGAAMALCAAAEDRGSLIRAVIAESPFTTLAEAFANYGLAFSVVRSLQRLNPELERRLRPELAVTQLAAETRLLLLYPEADSLTPTSMGKRLVDAYLATHKQTPEGVDIELMPGNAHMQLLATHPEAYSSRVGAFLASALR